MNVRLREMLARLTSFARKRVRDEDFEEELAVHVELAAEENRRRGMNAGEARRKALIDLGGAESAKELHRDARGLPGLESLLRDVRYALRQLWKSPGFTVTAVLSLALGIGGTTAMFSLIYALLLHPYPYAGAERMVRVSTADRSGNLRPISLTGSQFHSMRKAGSVADAVAWQNWELNTTGSGLPEDALCVRRACAPPPDSWPACAHDAAAYRRRRGHGGLGSLDAYSARL